MYATKFTYIKAFATEIDLCTFNLTGTGMHNSHYHAFQSDGIIKTSSPGLRPAGGWVSGLTA